MSELFYEEDLAWHRHCVKVREEQAMTEVRVCRRVMVVTQWTGVVNKEWLAKLDPYRAGDVFGVGPTEADAVCALYIEINEREAKEEEQHELAR